MSTSSRLKLLLASLLALSTVSKVIAGSRSLSGVDKIMQSTARDRIAVTLKSRGFSVDEAAAQQDSPFVPAAAGDCRLMVVLAAPEGWHRDIIHRIASPRDQVFFVFDGRAYKDQPRWLPWAHHYWQVLNLYVGRQLAIRPLLGIVASPDCDLRDVPWRELAEPY